MASNKKIITLLIILALHTVLFAQTPNLNEILRQKKTQRKYFAEQAVALEAYMEVLKDGYQIADNGLNLIGNVTGDEQLLHGNRLSILKGKNKSLDATDIVVEARWVQVSIIEKFNALLDECTDGNFLVSEQDYIHAVARNLENECSATVAMLDVLRYQDTMTMTDDERTDRINKVLAELNDQYEFTMDFCSGTRMLAVQRQKEKNDVDFIHKQL